MFSLRALYLSETVHSTITRPTIQF